MRTWTLLSAIAVAFVLPTHPAKAAAGDPLQNVYVFPGARDDNSGVHAGVATAVICTTFSSTTEKIRWIALNFDGSKVGDVNFTTTSGSDTRTMTTHSTALYDSDVIVSNPGPLLNQGAIYVFATTTNIVCTANIVAAASTTPQGIDLHALRATPPFPGSQE
jgi:hypothetical protein